MNHNYFKSILFFFVIAVISCSDNTNQLTSPSQIDESLGYFPVNIENNWLYKSEQSSFEQKIVVDSKIIVNGNEYFILSNLGEHSYPDTIRIEDNIVWKYTDNKEVLWFNFDSENNSSYKYKSYDVRVETDIHVETFIGEFSNCIAFYFDIPEIADEEVRYIFAKGVGVVRMPGAWVDLKLFSFRVKN